MDLDSTVRELAPKLLGYCFLETGDPGLAEEILAGHADRTRAAMAATRSAGFAGGIRVRHRPPEVRARDGQATVVAAARGGVRPARRPPESGAGRRSIGRTGAGGAGAVRLRPTDRQVLLLLTVWDLGMEDAARTLGISLSAAKMRAMRARQRLRELLEEGNGNGPRMNLGQARSRRRPRCRPGDRRPRGDGGARERRRERWGIRLGCAGPAGVGSAARVCGACHVPRGRRRTGYLVVRPTVDRASRRRLSRRGSSGDWPGRDGRGVLESDGRSRRSVSDHCEPVACTLPRHPSDG